MLLHKTDKNDSVNIDKNDSENIWPLKRFECLIGEVKKIYI